MPNIRIIKIDSKDVEAHPKQYNSSFHDEPEVQDLPIPTEELYSFDHWLPLIARSRNNPLDTIQTILLSRTEANLVLSASMSSIQTREPNRLFAEELNDILVPTLSPLIFPAEGLFLRLDACSPKDGAKGIRASKTVQDVILQLTTSSRARNAIATLLDHSPPKFELYFLPFNERMDTDLEYRVFCAPPDGEITAVSQYRWHKRSIFADRLSEIPSIIEKIMENINRIHEDILRESKTSEVHGLHRLPEQGFSFDVMFEEETGKCSLIELNGFGVRGAAGSCLYHWIRDKSVLYGSEMDGVVEFRIAV